MILITSINENIFITADKLISGHLTITTTNGKVILRKNFNQTNHIIQRIEDKHKKLKIEIVTQDEKLLKTINFLL